MKNKIQNNNNNFALQNSESLKDELSKILENQRISKNPQEAGILDGAKIGWAKELNVPETAISDQAALQETIFLNEQITIKRID